MSVIKAPDIVHNTHLGNITSIVKILTEDLSIGR